MNDSNEMTLSLANPDELPQIEYLMIDNSDKIIKPIIGNKIIEKNELTIVYDENKLPIQNKYKIDKLKELVKDGKIFEFQNFLNHIFLEIGSLIWCLYIQSF